MSPQKIRRVLSYIALFTVVSASTVGAKDPIRLAVDASEATRKIFHARLTIPAAPGPLTLVYPKWIPGEHGPTGPITDLAGLQLSASGKPVSWRRESSDMYAFHVEIPPGTSALEVAFDYLSPAEAEGFSSGASATAQLTVISWNQLLLYPQGQGIADVTFTASLRLPAGWKYGTALPVDREAGNNIEFQPVSLETLVDSPVIAGAYFRTVRLLPGTTPPHQIDIAADSAVALDITAQETAAYEKLVAEAGALFGARHYRDYHFLLSLSDHVAHFGLEHHESSDERTWERSLIEPERFVLMASLLSHEFVHSWNGKYRRPADLTKADFQKPIGSELLWVYEGLTQYLGDLLAARSGLWTPEQYRDSVALLAANLDHSSGRTWRPLADTAVAAQLLYEARADWTNWRRSTDFYDESLLIWLEADTIIRDRSHGTHSIEDFCRRFHGGQSGPPEVKTYTLDDVLTALNAVAPYDWRGFFNERIYSVASHAPLGGLKAAGWRVVYTGEMSEMLKASEGVEKVADLSFSIGMRIKTGEEQSGAIADVNPSLGAARAGLAPGMKLIAVNGHRWSPEVLREAIKAARNSSAPIELLVENAEYFKTYSLDYHEGEKYPHLERIPEQADVLSQILKPLTAGR